MPQKFPTGHWVQVTSTPMVNQTVMFWTSKMSIPTSQPLTTTMMTMMMMKTERIMEKRRKSTKKVTTTEVIAKVATIRTPPPIQFDWKH